MNQEMMNALISVLATTLTGIITAVLIPALAKWISSKTDSQRMKYVIDELTQTAQTSVEFIEQTLVKQYKADGKWDAEAQKLVLNAAVDEVIQSLTSVTVNTLNKEKVNVAEAVTRYVESYIQTKKTKVNGGYLYEENY